MININYDTPIPYHKYIYATASGDLTGNNSSGTSDTFPFFNFSRADSDLSSNISQVDISSGNATTAAEFGRPAGPPPGVLQIPYTGLSRYHIEPNDARLFGLNDSTFAMMVTEVEPGSPAAIAGIRGGNTTTNVAGDIIKIGGDIILRIDGNDTYIKTNEAFLNYLQREKRAGENMTFTMLRDGRINDINLTVGALPRYLWYNDEDEGIRIKYPSDWEISQSESINEIVKFFTPTSVRTDNGTKPAAGIFVLINPVGDRGLDDLAEAEQRDTRDKRNLGITLTSMSNLPAYESTFYDYSDNRTLKKLSVFSIMDDRIYRIDFATDPSRYDDYLPLAKEVISSFQFIE